MSTEPRASLPADQLTVMVVDDSRTMQAVIAATLQELGIKTCHCVSSGEQALQRVKGNHPFYQLIFVDLNMPGMDGMQLIRELAKVRYRGGVVILSELDAKIIRLAGDVTRQHRIRLMGCLSKPITEDMITPILQRISHLHPSKEHATESLSERELDGALENNWLKPYYQPLVDSNNGGVYCLEVLARILKPGQSNAILPSRFINLAERKGLLESMTLSIMDQALSDFHAIHSELGDQCKLAFNLSPDMLFNSDLPDRLIEIIERHGIKNENLILEITENQVMDQTRQLETLNRLRIRGFNLALDDFGTGFTNIQQLKGLPYTEIKIDRSMIRGIHQDKLSQVVVSSLMDIFSELGAIVVAEGVELEADLRYLNSLPVSPYFQGFFISRPKSLDSIMLWRKSWQKVFSAD